MAEITTKKVDALGFDKWQIADIKRAYRSNSMSYTKMGRLKTKIDALIEEFEAERAKTEAWEGPVKVITNNVLGMELTSLEVLRYHEHPEEFYAKYPEHPLSIAVASAGTAAPANDATPAESAEPANDADPVEVNTPSEDAGLVFQGEGGEAQGPTM